MKKKVQAVPMLIFSFVMYMKTKIRNMIPNIIILLACAFIPFIIALVWFHKKTFGGDTWNSLAALSAEKASTQVKPLKLVLSILLNFFIAFGLYNFCVHESGILSLVHGDVELLKTGTALALLNEYGGHHLSFGHGIVHGIGATILFVLPLYGYVTIFEKKSAKYLLVNLGFWLISLCLMAGVLCQWGWTQVY